MAKTNYGFAKRQKEAARKARQQKKQDRRQARVDETPPTDAATAADGEQPTPVGESET